MSNSPGRPSNRKSDRTAAVTLEVPSGVADDIEAVLRGYAEEAELDTSLVVDHSGFLIAGISSLPDVDVDTIGALVAGASGATEGLTGALGEEGRVESLHLGEDRLLYLKEIGERFILVGVSDSNVPAGILRDQANLIEAPLLKLLEKVKAVPMSLTKKKAFAPIESNEVKPPPPKSLRQAEPAPEPEPEVAEKEPAPVEPPRPQARPVVAKVTAPQVVKSEKTPEKIEAKPGARIGGMIPGIQASVTPAIQKKDPIPDEIFEEAGKGNEAIEVKPKAEEAKAEIPAEVKRAEPHAIVENSPFEMDDGDEEEESTFKPARPHTTPVHLSVPAARQREAAARKKQEEDEDNQSGPRYSFELG
ncbi:MAG: roadblock/LC7 domain-containing protein [Verrucomicrobiales bacterium]|nr:roadblock/LC7 domain-containing protein [Verrucomicrobiales bacterium]